MEKISYKKLKPVFDLFPEISNKAVALLDREYKASDIAESLGVKPQLIYRWKRTSDLEGFMRKDQKNLEMRDNLLTSLDNVEASKSEEVIPF